jgi:hypothetical protein
MLRTACSRAGQRWGSVVTEPKLGWGSRNAGERGSKSPPLIGVDPRPSSKFYEDLDGTENLIVGSR